MPSSPCWAAVTGRHVSVRRKSSTPVVVRGEALSDLDLWRLAGALDGTYLDVEEPRARGGGTTEWFLDGVNLRPSEWQPSGVLAATRNGPYGSVSHRRLDVSDNGNGNAVLHNRGYYLRDALQGQGIAWAALCLQVEVAHRVGVARIEVHLEANARGALTNRIGRLQWPKLGFDGPVPAEVLQALGTAQRARLRLSPSPLLSELLATPEGLNHWTHHPVACALTLDLEVLGAAAQTLLTHARSKPPSVRT